MSLIIPHLLEAAQDVNMLTVPIQEAEIHQKRQGQPQNAAAVKTAAEIDKNLSQSRSDTGRNRNSKPGRELWQAGIGIPKDDKNEENKLALQRVIDQIRSVEFKLPGKAPESAAPVEPGTATESDAKLSDPGTPEKHEEKIETKLPYKPVTDQTLQKLDSLSQHPELFDNPLELAEILFHSGRLKEAEAFYRQALKRTRPDEAGSAPDRAWILFQTGNCLRNDNRPTAAKMYRQVITEYPDSPWAALAKVQDKLIEWYKKDEPRKLIAENQ